MRQKILLYENGRCTFSAGKGRTITECQEIGRTSKGYKITNAQYNNIIAAAFKLARSTTRTLNFYTFTFANNPCEIDANKAIGKFFKELLREFESDIRYIWTKERQKNGKIHFHSLLDSGYIPVQSLQALWNRSILFACGNVELSNNSFRLPPVANRKIFSNKDIISIARYIGKYVSKERANSYQCPVCSISKRLYPLYIEISLAEYETLVDTFGIYRSVVHEFCSVIQLNNAEYYR